MFTKTQLAGGQPLGQSARYIAAKLASNLVIYRGWKRNDSTVMVHGPDMNLSSLTVSKVHLSYTTYICFLDKINYLIEDTQILK